MKTLLDDAAAHATTELSIDLSVVRQRAGAAQVQARRVRRQGVLVAGLAVAATIALVAVLFPGSSVRSAVLPADEPAPLPAVTGLPSNWYAPPRWTPPVTRHPMTAAVMVLEADLLYGAITRRHEVRGPVLVSADARTYASLPSWSDFDGGVTLSPDGRKVAWYTDGHADAPPVVHQLTLTTGRSVDTEGSWGSRAVSLVWQGGSLVFTEADQAVPEQNSTVRIAADGSAASVLLDAACLPAAGVAPTGQLGHAAATHTGSDWAVSVRSGPTDSTACAGDFIGRAPVDIPVRSTEPVVDVTVLAWTRAGIVIQVATKQGPGYSTHRSLRLADPNTLATTVVSRPRETVRAYPVAVAADLITTAVPITAPRPVYAERDRSHLVFLAALAWGGYRTLILFTAFLLLAGLTALITWRIRRRHLDLELT